jgi:hypothetical protein
MTFCMAVAAVHHKDLKLPGTGINNNDPNIPETPV